MKLSVVILNYNVCYFLEQCLRSVQLAIQDLDAEIIVIDNDSHDGSCEMVRTLFPTVTLLENKENVGFSRANNQAVAVAKGEYVCILNPDTAVAEDTFHRTLEYSEKVENIGAVGVYLMDGTGNFLPESKRNLPTPKVSVLKLAGFSQRYYSRMEATATGEVAVLVGAFMLLKRSVYNEVGGFDEDYFMYGEDIDLSYKISKAGYKNHYLGNTTVLHYKGESTMRDEKYFDRFYGAMQIFYRKHFNKNIIIEGSVSAGVALAKRAKRLSAQRKMARAPLIKNKLVLTENPQLVSDLNRSTKGKFERVPTDFFNPAQIENSLLVFDAEYLSFKGIFELMKQMKQRNNLFRIKPPQGNFIIGSDRSDEKGGVIVF